MVGPPLAVVDVFTISGCARVMGKLLHVIETCQREHRYLIHEDDWADAPHHITAAMQQIFKSAEALRTSRAHQEGMFWKIDIEHVLYSAAKHAVQAAELNASKWDLQAGAGPADEDALRRARVALRKIGRFLDKVEAELKEAAKTAKHLSENLTEAERARAAAREKELAAERRREARAEARARVEKSTARAKSATRIDTTDIAERVASVSAGYDEARKISDNVLGDPSSDTAQQSPSLMQSVWNAACSAARWIIQ